MAKPIQQLLTELQRAFDTAEADRTALDSANKKANESLAKAKAAYDAVVDGAKAEQQTAQAKANDSAGYVRSLQDEINSILGRFDSRVRVG